jgi:hypothetical protein
MIRRMVAVVVALVAVVPAVLDRSRPAAQAAHFGELVNAPTPFGRSTERLSSFWYCPALPSRSSDRASVRVLNPGITDLSGTITIWENERPEPTLVPITVPAGASKSVDVAATRPGDVDAAMIEVVGGEVFVEASVRVGANSTSAPCASSVSDTWSFADGSTEVDATYRLAVFNPFPTDTVVDVDVITEDGVESGGAGRGVVVSGRSMRVINVNEQSRRSSLASVVVRARGSKVVVGRLLTFNNNDRKGLVAGVASAGQAPLWWFAGGGTDTNVSEQLVILNSNSDRAELELSVFPINPAAVPEQAASKLVQQVSVSPNSSLIVPVAIEGLPKGPLALEVRSTNDVAVVVERVVNERTNTSRRTSAVAGSPVLAQRWYLVEGPASSAIADEQLAIVNPSGSATKVTVRQLVPGGERVVLEQDLAPGEVARVILTSVSAADVVSLYVRADSPIVVERKRNTAGAPWSLAIPIL